MEMECMNGYDVMYLFAGWSGWMEGSSGKGNCER